MKTLLLVASLGLFSLQGIAQGKGHGKGHAKHKTHQDKQKKSRDVAEHDGYGKQSRHQPKKVEAALLRDYPSASNVSWKKYKGDYYATFNHGLRRSTAVYHANGDRRDTRTPITRDQLPGGIWNDVFVRDNVAPTRFEQIERPSITESIFHILSGNNSYYYDSRGNRVPYAY